MKFNKKLTILIWVLSFTWALPTTLAGCVVALYLRLRGNKPKRFGPIFYFPITEDYGLNLGPFILVPKKYRFLLERARAWTPSSSVFSVWTFHHFCCRNSERYSFLVERTENIRWKTFICLSACNRNLYCERSPELDRIFHENCRTCIYWITFDNLWNHYSNLVKQVRSSAL